MENWKGSGFEAKNVKFTGTQVYTPVSRWAGNKKRFDNREMFLNLKVFLSVHLC